MQLFLLPQCCLQGAFCHLPWDLWGQPACQKENQGVHPAPVRLITTKLSVSSWNPELGITRLREDPRTGYWHQDWLWAMKIAKHMLFGGFQSSWCATDLTVLSSLPIVPSKATEPPWKEQHSWMSVTDSNARLCSERNGGACACFTWT